MEPTPIALFRGRPDEEGWKATICGLHDISMIAR
jgi:hypothetical protein